MRLGTVRQVSNRELRDGADEGLCVGFGGGVDDFFGVAGLDDFAGVHDEEVVAHVFDHGHVVRDEEVGEVVFFLEVLEQVDDLRLHRDIESTDRLVAHDEARLHGQCPGDADALALAATEFVRVAVEMFGLQADLPEQLGTALFALFAVELPEVDFQRLGEDLKYGEPRVERVVGVLKNHLHFAPQRLEPGRSQLAKVLIFVSDAAGCGAHELKDGFADGGLATATFADQADGGAFGDVEAYTIHGLDVRQGFAQQRTACGEPDLEVADAQKRSF